MGGLLSWLSVPDVLSEKPWRLEAIGRLVAALVVCMILGTVALFLLNAQLPVTTNSTTFFTLAAGSTAALTVALTTLWRPWTPDNFAPRSGLFLGLVFIGYFMCGMTQRLCDMSGKETSLAGFAVQILSFQGVAIPLLAVFVVQHGLRPRDGFGLNQRPQHALLLGATVGLGLTTVCLGLHEGLGLLAQYFGIPLPQQKTVFVLRLAESWLPRVVLGVATILVVPLAEEGLFRGVLYPKLKQASSPAVALLATSLLFAAIHNNALSFMPLVVLAAGLTLLYERTGNLLAPIACHALFNAFNYVMIFVLKDPTGP